MWMLNILETFHLRESLNKFKEEEHRIEDDVKIVRDDLAQMQRHMEEISTSSTEIAKLRQKTSLWHTSTKDRIKYFEENKQRAEEDFQTILQRYVKEATGQNKTGALQAVEREVLKKEELMTALREKRIDYEARLKGK